MNDVVIVIDPRLYRLAAVKKAAYRLGDRCFAQIVILPDERIEVTLRPKSDRIPLASLDGEFRNELLDQDLRESIAEETAGVRNLLLAHAFSGLSPAENVSDTADYRQDPLGIAQSQAHPR